MSEDTLNKFITVFNKYVISYVCDKIEFFEDHQIVSVEREYERRMRADKDFCNKSDAEIYKMIEGIENDSLILDSIRAEALAIAKKDLAL